MNTLLNAMRDAIEQPTLTDALNMVRPIIGVKTPLEKSQFFITDKLNKIRSNHIWWRSMEMSEKVDIVQKYVAFEIGSLYMEYYWEEIRKQKL